jgi:tRNA C32,U32 (ribose-2'-O)-methylase TrmJ
MDRLRRLFSKARLEKVEVNILRGILTTWDERNSQKK